MLKFSTTIFIINVMRIITNEDITSLILYAKYNLGSYNLIFKRFKKLYWTIVYLVGASFLALVICIFSILFNAKWIKIITIIICILTSAISLYLIHKLEMMSHNHMKKLQNYRLYKLVKYYRLNGYVLSDIKIINDCLALRKHKIERYNTTLLVMLGILILPVWENLVQYLLTEFSVSNILAISFLATGIALILTLSLKHINHIISICEENIASKDNTHIIQNIIYLNKYIIERGRL